MILSGARDLADPPLDPLRLAASNALDLQLSRRRSARLERHFRWCVRCLFIALAIATAVRIWLE